MRIYFIKIIDVNIEIHIKTECFKFQMFENMYFYIYRVKFREDEELLNSKSFDF